MAILGGVLHGSYKLLKDSPNRKGSVPRFLLNTGLPQVLTGAFAGMLAYLLVNWGILGIKVDTTTLQGFVILGFLFSYVGIDLILKTVTQHDSAAPRQRDFSSQRQEATQPDPG